MQRSDGNFKVLQADQPDFERGVAYWDTIEARCVQISLVREKG